MNRDRRLPNFLIVGAEKAGTTSLAAALSGHPDIFIPADKELRFFSDHNWARGIEWYETFFAEAGSRRAVGEASPAYTWHPECGGVPERIHETLGDIRYIYILRHPVERLASHYRHAIYHGWVPPDTGFEQALQLRPQLKICSRYFYQLEQYLPFTSRDQWLFPALEDLIRDPAAVHASVFRFLEVDDKVRVPAARENVMDDKSVLPSGLRSLADRVPGSGRVLRGVRHLGGRLLRRAFGRRIPKAEIPPGAREALCREFREDAAKLSEFTGRDFVRLWSL